jgi:hypothetical protein
MIKQGDILEMRDGRAYEVLSGYTDSLVKGDLLIIEVDLDNNRIGQLIDFKIDASTPIMDIIR